MASRMNGRFKIASYGFAVLLVTAASSYLSAANKPQSLAFKNAASDQRIFTLPPDDSGSTAGKVGSDSNYQIEMAVGKTA